MNRKIICGGVLVIALAAGVASVIRVVYCPQIVAKGCFHQVAHLAKGCVELQRFHDGRLQLAISDLEMTGSTDVEVLLITASDAFENEAVLRSSRYSLGGLKPAGNYQTYQVPDGVSPDEVRSVTIWNKRHNVNYATAPLEPAN